MDWWLVGWLTCEMMYNVTSWMLNHAQVTDEHILLASWSGGRVVSVSWAWTTCLNQFVSSTTASAKFATWWTTSQWEFEPTPPVFLSVSLSYLLTAKSPSVSLFYLTHFHWSETLICILFFAQVLIYFYCAVLCRVPHCCHGKSTVCLSVCDVEVWSHRLEHLENNFTAD